MIFSVHNSLIAIENTKISQFQTSKSNTVSIQSPQPISSYMNYSDNCNRILISSQNSLHWLKVSEASISLVPAASLPISGTVSQIVNLSSMNASGIVTVLCFSPYYESVSIRINLKQLAIALVV